MNLQLCQLVSVAMFCMSTVDWCHSAKNKAQRAVCARLWLSTM